MSLQRSHPHDHTYAESMQKYHILKIRYVGGLLILKTSMQTYHILKIRNVGGLLKKSPNIEPFHLFFGDFC